MATLEELENRIAQVASGLGDRVNVLEQCGCLSLLERVAVLERKIEELERRPSSVNTETKARVS